MRSIAGLVIACALTQAIPAVASEMKAVPAAEQQRTFAQPQVFRGQLGAKLIEMHLQPKKDEPESLEGYYLIGPDWKKKVLLAGEWSGAQISLEESENGTDVSGTLEAEWLADGLSGNWMPADETVKVTFRLQPVKTRRSVKHKI